MSELDEYLEKLAGECMSECFWVIDDDDDNEWITTCDNRFILSVGTPEENGFNYCPYCGKTLRQKS